LIDWLVLFSENVHEENFEKLEKWRKIRQIFQLN